jgi:hypothetical protein
MIAPTDASLRRIARWMAECGISATIPTEAFCLLAATIDQFKARPWTVADIAEMKKSSLEQIADRRRRRLAATSLETEAEPWRLIPGMAGRVRRWDEAIAVLRMARGAQDSPDNWMHFSGCGQNMRPWTYMATEIGGWVLQILRSYELPRPSFGVKSPVVQFVHKALTFIGVKDAPQPKTLGNKLRVTLARLLRNWPAPGNSSINGGRTALSC